MKLYDLIVNGTFTPQTVPTGGKTFTEKFQPPAPAQPDTVQIIQSSKLVRLCTDSPDISFLPVSLSLPHPPFLQSSDIRRKLSTDQMPVEPGVGEQRLDTPPSSLGGPYTPGSSCSSQGGGTPYTSRSGTPFSQDSGYSGSR